MLLTRDDVLEAAGVTDEELARLERQRLVVPERRWHTLWLRRYYRRSHVAVIRWLVACKRAEAALERRERASF